MYKQICQYVHSLSNRMRGEDFELQFKGIRGFQYKRSRAAYWPGSLSRSCFYFWH